jgi:1,4-dihydroxy-2-naphthoate octaprenyltransferase
VPVPSLTAVVLAARPKTLPAAVVPVWAGCVLAWRLTGAFDLTLALCTLGGSVAIQIATNFFNDAIDSRKGADTARRLGPTRVTAAGLMAPGVVLACATGFLLLAVGCGTLLYQARGWPIVAIGVPSLLLAYGYTGGPFPLAYRGLGELFVILFFGLVAVSGTTFIQTGAWPLAGLLLGWQVGLLSAVLISINNLRDRGEDSTTGKRTLAVRWGERAAVAVIGAELGLAALASLGWVACGLPWLAVAGVPVVAMGARIFHGVRHAPPGPAFNRLLALGGGLLLVFATVFQVVALVK